VIGTSPAAAGITPPTGRACTIAAPGAPYQTRRVDKDVARPIAHTVHAGQRDRFGEPLVERVTRVAAVIAVGQARALEPEHAAI
jgi:hypothetical protein